MDALLILEVPAKER